ncbi:MAG: glycosyltransferase family A protein [Rhodospirillales bacterium]
MAKLVSILVPAYNAEKWIADTIASATQQTWPHKEVIVLDDGSADGTFKIAQTLASPSVKVVRQENAGACRTRNNLLAMAQGDYIQWLDADDLLDSEKIARQLEGADDGRTSLTLLTAEWGRFFFRYERAKFIPDALWQDLGPTDWILARFNENVWMNPVVWLVSRRLTEAAGPWDERLSASGDDDGEYICRVAGASDGVRFVAGARCYYRIGTIGSLNWNMERSEKSLDSLVLSLTLAVRHLRSLENSERTRKAAVRHLQTFLPYFYAADRHYFHELDAVAREFGGALHPPRASWKYSPIETVFGARSARNVMANWRAVKLLAQRDVDRLLHRIGL